MILKRVCYFILFFLFSACFSVYKDVPLGVASTKLSPVDVQT